MAGSKWVVKFLGLHSDEEAIRRYQQEQMFRRSHEFEREQYMPKKQRHRGRQVGVLE